MGPKKKGKQNKLARMSDDERLRYLQHKAAQEEEARRRKQQLIATFLKNKIKQEENFARLNQAKIDEQWRHLLRKAKCKELKLELETSRQQFEHLLTRRNQVINSLQEDLHESECQYLVILQAHMEAVDKILSMGTNRVTQQAERYVRQKSYMLEMAKQEAEFESSRNRRAQKLLLTVLFAIREAAAVLQNQMKSKALTKRTEIRNSYSEEMQALQLRLGGHLDNLQEQLQNVFRSYTTSTQELRRMYEEMKDRDEENLEIIAKHEEVIAKLLAEEEKLQNQLDTFQKGTTPRSTKLQAQERQLSAECWRVRKQQQNKLRIDELKIKNITLTSSKCIEKLEKVKQKGENLLKIAQLCSKLETEEEKVILNYAAPEQASSAETTESSEIQDPTEIPHGMENFWRRHSQALLSRAALRMHYDTLMQENQQLRSAVRQYLATAASSSMTPSSAPLLLARKLRGRKISLITMPNSRPPKPPACIEAAIAVKTMLK